jgi:predicted transcriptional regulator
MEEPVGDDADVAGTGNDGKEKEGLASVEGSPETASAEEVYPEPVSKDVPVPTRHKPLPPARWAAAKKAYIDGNLSVTETACILGVSRAAVQGHVDRGRWTELRRQHKEETRASLMAGVDERALERRKRYDEEMRRGREDVLKGARYAVGVFLQAADDWVKRREAHEAARKFAVANNEDDPGPMKAKAPVKASDVNSLVMALNGLLDHELKMEGKPTSHSRVDMQILDLNEYMVD